MESKGKPAKKKILEKWKKTVFFWNEEGKWRDEEMLTNYTNKF